LSIWWLPVVEAVAITVVVVAQAALELEQVCL
jgi:hypothetical protein